LEIQYDAAKVMLENTRCNQEERMKTIERKKIPKIWQTLNRSNKLNPTQSTTHLDNQG
jgi:hypothetical protein